MRALGGRQRKKEGEKSNTGLTYSCFVVVVYLSLPLSLFTVVTSWVAVDVCTHVVYKLGTLQSLLNDDTQNAFWCRVGGLGGCTSWVYLIQKEIYKNPKSRTIFKNMKYVKKV